jgi:prolyl-tRNA editing enzyme YbaK/EbsC (Cys-tRNA(Pro) deacylase)
MAHRWPDAVERVASFLRAAGAEARLEEFSEGTPTAEDAARAVGCPLAQIVKSLVFDCEGRAVLALVPGDRRADPRRVALAAGCGEARVASADLVLRSTGYRPGAVAPLALRAVDRVLVVSSILSHEVVWIGAGSPNHLASIAPDELVRLARAERTDLTA